jgi:hypothetical protein
MGNLMVDSDHDAPEQGWSRMATVLTILQVVESGQYLDGGG